MPFIVTEPQKINGTELGFSVYPYQFSFQDRFGTERKFNQKLVIFKMKNSPFIEIDKTLFETKYRDYDVPRNYVDKLLESFVKKNPQYVKSPQKASEFFENSPMKEMMENKSI